MKFCRKWK